MLNLRRPVFASARKKEVISAEVQTEPVNFPVIPFAKQGRFRDKTVTIGIASIPHRRANLKSCIDSLYHQSDNICVFLNNYEEVPDFLRAPKIHYVRSQDFRDLNAIGKVYFIDWATDGYYFTIDDDFVYPSNYIAEMTRKIDLYKRTCAVTVHGSIFPHSVDWYYERTAMYQYQAPLPCDRYVHLPGTGSFGFHKSTLNAAFKQFLPLVMVDLTFAILCKRQKVPIVSIKRPAMWLMNTERSGLFQQFSASITHHTLYARAESPWSFEDYGSYVDLSIQRAFGRLKTEKAVSLELDVDFLSCRMAKNVPDTWSTSMTTMRRKLDAMKMSPS